MLWQWLRKWWNRPNRASWNVILYTRKGCSLCSTAWTLLEESQREYGFHLEMRDIEADLEFLARYEESIPVVTVNGRERFRGRINPTLLRRLLEHG